MKNDLKTSCTVVDYKCKCFEYLTEEENQLISDNEVVIEYKKGETIFKQGALAAHIMIVEKGLAKVCVEENNNTLILKIIPEGNMLGLTSVSKNAPTFQYSAIAYMDSTVRLIDINVFRKVISQNAEFALELINILSANSVQISGRFFCLTNKQSYGKLADILLCLSENVFKKQEFELNLSRKDLAELSGMSTENVIRMLKKFKDDGLIEIEGKVFKISNSEKLKQISKSG